MTTERRAEQQNRKKSRPRVAASLGVAGHFAAGWTASMWRLCIEDDESNRTVVNLVRKQYTIGRTEDNAIRLTERNISRQHAVLERREDRWYFRDLDSYNGSFAGGQRVPGEVEVDHASELRVGDYQLVLIDSEREDETVDQVEPSRRSNPTSSELAYDRLVVVEGPGCGQQFPLRADRLVVGRGEECELALNDTSVSRVHALLERDEQGRFHIADRESSNGVRVNGMEVDRIALYAGDLIELGDVQLQFVPKGTPFDASALGARAAFSSKPRSEAPKSKRWMGLAAVGLLTALGLYAAQGRPTRVEPGSERSRAALQLLEEADRLAQRGDLERSHALLAGIATTSTLRNNQRFLALEARWADHQFELAERSDDAREQQWLLRRVSESSTVDSMRRQRALKWLEDLTAAEQAASIRDAGVDASTQTVASSAAAATTRSEPPRPQPPVAARPVSAKPSKPAAPAPWHHRPQAAPPAEVAAAAPKTSAPRTAARTNTAAASPTPAPSAPKQVEAPKPAPPAAPAPSPSPPTAAPPVQEPTSPPTNRYPTLPARLLPSDSDSTTP